MLQGESQGRALERVIPLMNASGYRVAFVLPDSISVGRKILNLLVGVVTLGFYYQTEGLLIIGERIDA